MLCSTVASALENTYLYKSLQEEVEELKRAEEKIKQYSENLEHMVEERTRSLNTTLHDVEEARDRIDGIIKSVGDGLIVTDLYNKVVLMSFSRRVSSSMAKSMDRLITSLKRKFSRSSAER